MKGLLFLMLALCPLFLCSSSWGSVVLEEPTDKPWPPSPTGKLTVFSATQQVETGDYTFSYPHTAYTIFRDGIIYKLVPNHVGDMDEVPMTVKLPPASYVVRVEDEAYGRLRIPVTIKKGQHVFLDLERGWKPPASIEPDKYIRWENGRVIGFVE